MSELNCFILRTTQMARILGSKENRLLSKTEHKLSEKHLDSRAFVIQLGTRTGENACFQRDNFTPAALKQLFSGTVILSIFHDKTKVASSCQPPYLLRIART